MTQKSARLGLFGKQSYWLLSVSMCHQAFLPSSTTRWPPLQYRLKRTSPRPHYLMQDAAYWGRLGQKPAETHEVPAGNFITFCWLRRETTENLQWMWREITMKWAIVKKRWLLFTSQTPPHPSFVSCITIILSGVNFWGGKKKEHVYIKMVK